ncbi:MAG: glycine betaine ABC transporter substrate-binding protein [Acidimicrobiales bacterium]
MSALLTTEELTELNRQFTVDKLDADEVAATWLADKGLVG